MAKTDMNECILLCIVLVYDICTTTFAGVGPINLANTAFLSDLQSFYDGVNGLRASGGGDTPEYALDGMLQGLTFQTAYPDANGNFLGNFDVMIPGSQMVVITDAPSKRPEIKNQVINDAVLREVCIHFFLSPDGNPTGDGIYQDIASMTSGTLINNFADWQLASFVAAYSTNPCKYTTGKRNKRDTSAPSECQHFNVSTLAVNLKLTIRADPYSVITITRPNGMFTTENVGSGGFAVFAEGLPQPGKWVACTNRGTVDVTVSIQNALDTTIFYQREGSEDVTDVPPPACKLEL